MLGLASPMDGTDKMEMDFSDEKKQRENTHQRASIEVMTTWLASRTNMSRWNMSHNFAVKDMVSGGGCELL